MCLASVFEIPPDALNIKSGIGYKAMSRVSDGYDTWLYPFETMQMGETYIDDAVGNLITFDYVQYPTGFHICLTPQDAGKFCTHRDCVVVKVEFHDVVATGEQQLNPPIGFDGKPTIFPCIVARKIKLIEEVTLDKERSNDTRRGRTTKGGGV